MVLKTLQKKPTLLPFALFGIGIIFFGIGVYNPVPSGQVDPNFGVGVLFFAAGIATGIAQAFRKKKR